MTFIIKNKEQIPQTFERLVNNLINNSFGEKEPTSSEERYHRTFQPKINIVENENSFELLFALPGWTKGDVEVNVDNEVLIVKGEKNGLVKENVTWHSFEYDYGVFEKRFKLPDDKFGDVKAELKDGILTITIAKKVKKESQKKIVVS